MSISWGRERGNGLVKRWRAVKIRCLLPLNPQDFVGETVRELVLEPVPGLLSSELVTPEGRARR